MRTAGKCLYIVDAHHFNVFRFKTNQFMLCTYHGSVLGVALGQPQRLRLEYDLGNEFHLFECADGENNFYTSS